MQQINFYTTDFRQHRQLLTSGAFLRVISITAVAMLVTFSFAQQSLRETERERATVAQQEQVAIARLQKLQPIISAMGGNKTWGERQQERVRLLQEKQLILQYVQGTQLGDTQGFSRHLRSLSRVDQDGVWLHHIRLSALGDSTQLEGTALRAELVPAYLQYLAAETPFAAQRFRQFQIESLEDRSDGAVSFSVTSDPQLAAKSVVAK